MKHHFIINPAAGKGTHVKTLTEKIHAAAQNIEYEIYLTKCPGDAVEYVAKAVSADGDLHRFYACGGDGTLGEVINGAPACERAQFALIPIGTGNDFCRNFDDRSAFFDIERQINGTPMSIDLIRYNDRYCVNMLNVGFDCNVVERTVRFKKSPIIPSSMAYTTGVAVSLLHKMTTNMHITLDDAEVLSRPMLLLSVGNGKYYGGGYRSNPCSLLDDGLFDVNIVEKVSRFTFLSLVSSYKAGTHLETAKQHVTYRQSTSLKIAFDTDTMVCVDGELETARELTISIAPAAARFILPYGVACTSSVHEYAGVGATATEEHYETV